MKKNIFLIFSLLFSLSSFSQKYSLSGYIEHSYTGERLIGANIYLPELNTGTVTNNFGFFSINGLQVDSISLTVSYIGFKNLDTTLILNCNKSINFQLVNDDNNIQEIVISGSGNNLQKRQEMSILEIKAEDIKNLPYICGEPDIMKAIQLTPGVQTGGEGSSGLYVRGGAADQNLILLDDVPLYYVNHLGGFVSVFNSDAINSIKLIKAGFPASYGNRLSSVVDIRMKDGNMKKTIIQGGIGIITSRISLEGPIKIDTSSYIISARRFMLDLFSKPISRIATKGSALGYTFYDINAKVNYKFNNKNRVYFSFYSGDDKNSMNYYSNNIDKIKIKNSLHWGNLLCAFRWNHVYFNKLFSNTTLTYSRYRYIYELYMQEKEESDDNSYYSEIENIFKSKINDFNLKSDFEWNQSKYYKMLIGVNSVLHYFTPCVTSNKLTVNNNLLLDTIFLDNKYRSFENAAYLENYISINEFIKLNIGFRVTAYSIENKTFCYAEPRSVLNIQIFKLLALKGSYAIMHQNIHFLSFLSGRMPIDLWVPATVASQPEKSEQYAVGLVKTFSEINFEFSVEAYYKEMSNLIVLQEANSQFSGSVNWEDKVLNNGRGYSKGIEFFLQKTDGKFTGWIGYTLSKTTRQFEELNNGNPYTYKYDRTHDVSIVIDYEISKKVNFSATWVYGTGNAISLPTQYYNSPGMINPTSFPFDYFAENRFIESYNNINSFRMKAYHKLDIALNFIKQKKNGERTWSFSVYNAYNRQNPYYYFFENYAIYDQNGLPTGKYERKLYQQSLFPIIPSVSYSFKF